VVCRKSLWRKQCYFLNVRRMEYGKARGRVSSSVLGALIMARGRGVKEPITPELRTLFTEELKREWRVAVVEFLFNSVSFFVS